VEVREHREVEAFLEVTSALLLRDEARHNLVLGICSTLLSAPATYPTVHLWTVEGDGCCVGAALMTPPYNLALAKPAAPGALAALASGIREQRVSLPGVTAALPEADAFASKWQRRTGARPRVRRRQGIYQVTDPRPPTTVEGRLRPAEGRDRDLLVEWVQAFVDEAAADHVDPARFVDGRLRGPGGMVVWEHGEAVSLAGYGGRTPNGVRIGPVYTPPAKRRNGYASALVAALSARLLAEGRSHCFLYTDLANPTANRIYTAIGYELVAESAEIAFEPG
jgi:uncharacterized protein